MASTKWISFTVSKSNIWNLEMLGFSRGRKTGVPGEKTLSKDKDQHQIQPPYGVNTGNPTQATLVGDECSHYFAIPAAPLEK